MKSKKRNRFLYLVISFGILVLDQISKYFISQKLQVVCNNGGAWGIAGNVLPIVIVVLVFVAILMAKEENRWNLVGFALIFGGGLSNLFDRLFLGCVRDFINIGLFPSFNLADSSITVGVVLVLFNLVLGKNKKNEYGS